MANAIVIGAGPVGATTALLLAERGFEVVVLDRDPPAPDTADEAWEQWERPSVTQFHQVHFLQPRGRALLEEHVPRVLKELQAAGAVKANLVASLASLLPGGDGGFDFERFHTYTTCRRPVLEYAFAAALRSTPGIQIRNGAVVTALTAGAEVIPGVPHVGGVEIESGEAFAADIVIDASGRRSPVGGLLEALGAQRPPEHVEEVGFVYNTAFYRGESMPEFAADPLAAMGSVSVLTMPGDRDHWSVTIYHSPKDKPLRKVRDADVFERVVRAMPLHAHWVDGERVSDIISMASTANTQREFVVDGTPVATGLVPVGDAWGFTNPSIGRGITLGIMHAIDVVGAVAGIVDDPAAVATAWREVTDAQAAPWHDATVQFDRIRGPEVEAYRQGLPDPHDPNDMVIAGTRALDSARHYDAEVLHAFGGVFACFDLPSELMMKPGLFEKVIEVAMANPPYACPAPTRAELEEIVA
jgi:2-polyprenyl-6-methoxyphenol hydroxylase-like FAD-dependent oxidoreductase